MGRAGHMFPGPSLAVARARIPIPGATKPVAVLTLLAAVGKGIAQHGPDGPIGGALAAAVAAAAAQVPAALAAQKRAEDLLKEVEKLYQQRNLVVAEGVGLVQRAAKVLQGHLGPDSLHAMGAYGYTVNKSVRKPRVPKKPPVPAPPELPA